MTQLTITDKLQNLNYDSEKCSKLKVSPHFEQLGVMQDSSILRYLCSSCCQKFPGTGDKNLLILTFPTNLAQGACMQEKSLKKTALYFIFHILSRCGSSSVSLIAVCWLTYQVVQGKTSHHIIVKG